MTARPFDFLPREQGKQARGGTMFRFFFFVRTLFALFLRIFCWGVSFVLVLFIHSYKAIRQHVTRDPSAALCLPASAAANQ